LQGTGKGGDRMNSVNDLIKQRRKILAKTVLTQKDEKRVQELQSKISSINKANGIIPFGEMEPEEQIVFARKILNA
jgi:hypothetical protein